ncbi:MAG: glycosyltransferase family 25 protein [Chloroflexota bacterium]
MTARRPALPGAWAEVLAAPAFVINLDRAPERLGPVLARLAAAGFTDVRRVRGVDGLVPAELAAAWAAFGNPYFRDDNRPDALLPGKPGMQGAYLSHALLWRRIVEENIPFCTIFEDDAAFHRGWADLAPAYYAATPPDADAVWLGSWAFGAEMQGIMALPLPVVGLFATLLTREGARQMLELSVGNPLGVFAFDSMVRNAQFAVSSGNRPPFRWSVWTRPEREDPGFPPFEPVHNPAHGLVRSIQDDSSAQMNVAPARLQRALAAAAQEANSARGLLAADRLRCLHDLDPAMTDHARREQLALVRALGDGVGDGGAAPAIAIAPHPVATAPATPAVAAVPMDAPRSGLPATWQEVLDAPAFVINLDRTPDRMEQMLVRLAEAGFTDVRRVRGVDGLIPADLERGWAALGDPPLSEACIEPNRLGGRPCLQAAFASHGLLWRRIVDEGIPFCTIFEDDAAFHAGWADLAPGYYAETPRGAEVVWLGSWAFGADLTDAKVVTMPVLGFNSLLVSNAGARRLLDLTIGDPAGAYAFDCMVRDRQYAMLERGDRALDWVAWSRPAAEDPAFPPFHPWTYPAFGLAHSLRNESTAQLDEGAGRLVNTLRAAGESGNLAQGRLALDRLRCLHDLEPNLTADARRAHLAYIRPLGAAAGAGAGDVAGEAAAAPRGRL